MKIDEISNIKYTYDQKGNWIPVGYEDRKIALRSLEQPIGSNNWKVAVVVLDNNNDIDEIYQVKDSWDDAKLLLKKILEK